jgi:hypothetical protein
MVALGLSLAAVLTATFVPIEGQSEASKSVSEAWLVAPADVHAADVDGLLKRIAGRRLIEPSQGLAAVKDTGAAARLLASLKLQGVVKTGDRLVAYVDVDKQGVSTVGAGDRLLDFVVKDVTPGRVTLTLDGVEVSLGH